MRQLRLVLALSVLASTVRTHAAPEPDLAATAARFEEGVAVLAADDKEGRGLGTKGIAAAAAYIEEQLGAAGLSPAFGGSYRQKFPVKMGVVAGKGNRLEGVATGDFVPLAFSSSGSFSGTVAFAGYGIHAPALGFDELAGLDVKGKVVLALRYEPQERDEGSPFDGRKPSRYSSLRYRAMQARERGAAAVVFVTGPLQQEEGKAEKLPELRNDGPESAAGIPVLQVKLSVAERWLGKSGIDLRTLQEDVDRDLVPRPRLVEGVRVSGAVELETSFADAENVAGVIPGAGALAKEVVVLGAHYDHLGMGGPGSMRPNEKAIHNGADDNASGTMAVLLAAERLAKAATGMASRRTVVVALFSAEEVGLGGSGYFVKHPPLPDARTVAMVNLDMVGRYRDRLVALGSESAAEWEETVLRLAKGAGLEVLTKGDGYGPSDQTSFYAEGVPVLHLFTGAHDAYHTPDDDAGTLNAEGAARIVGLTAELAGELASGKLSPTYARATAAPSMEGDARGYGAYLGTVPDYTAMESTEGGVLLADVRPGGPADQAGIRGKDRIVAMAGGKIANLYDMTFVLQDRKPGETIDVTVVRDGKEQTLRATLGSRATSGAAEPGKEKAAAAPASQPVDSAQGRPADPHAAAPPAQAQAKLAAFYEGRPGADFVVGAGKPFAARFDGERHLADVRQLTFSGENAEAYFAPDGRHVIFQSTRDGRRCDAMFTMDLGTGEVRAVSSGKGRTTCGYYDWPESDRIVYASTEAASADCPPEPDRSKGYVWAVYEGYDIWEASPDGKAARRITETPGYDAEATWCHRGGKLVFTSVRDGDLDLYAMDEAGSVTRLTDVLGYDGGAFFSPDCSEIVWRASRPQGDEALMYQGLLSQGLVRPSKLELYLMKADGSGMRQLTANGAANFCPTFHPDGGRIIYSSNAGSESGREFELQLIDKESGDAERVTTAPGFDGFPHFSPDGRYLVWGSNRANPEGRSTNLFIARWVD